MSSDVCIRLGGINHGVSGDEAEEATFGSYLYDLRALDFQNPGVTATHMIIVDYCPKLLRTPTFSKGMTADLSLVQFEPKVVLPWNYSRRRYKIFQTIVRMGGDPSKFTNWLEWPQLWPSKLEHLDEGPSPRLEKVVSVNSNKISLIKGERYTLRRQAFNRIANIDIYGSSWDLRISQRIKVAFKALLFAIYSGNLPRPKSLNGWFRKCRNWRGQIGSGYSAGSRGEKLQVMSQYKYALVIENSTDYMSEKLFDAFFSGCIPIYVGPKVESFGIPTDLVIQVESNVESICKGLDFARSMDFKSFQRKLKSFLSDQKTVVRWSHVSVYEKLLVKLTVTSKRLSL